MKKKTQNTIFAIVVIVIFVGSSVAFFATGTYGGGTQQGDDLEPLTSTVIEGEIDPRLETAYLQGGFTFLKYYSDERPLETYVDSLPETTQLAQNQRQMFVQKLNSTNERIIIRGPGGESLLAGENLTESRIFETL